MAKKVNCTCGHSWSTADSSAKDKYVCHICGKDNTMKDGGWLNKYADDGGEYLGTTNRGFNYNGAWGGTMEDGGGGIAKAQVGDVLPASLPLMNLGIEAINKLVNLFSSSDEGKKTSKSYVLPETLNIKDPRKIRKTTGKPINPNVDLVSGKYETSLIKEALEDAKKYGLSKEDAWNLAAIGFQETGWGKTDDNIGHIKDNVSAGDTENVFLNAYLNKMKRADQLKITDPELRLQVYNGLGMIKPETEQSYHKFKMKKIYGVPVPQEGLNMKKNPLYGRQVIDIRDNVLRQNPDVVNYIESLYGEGDIPKKAMGGSLPGATGHFYARYNEGGLVPGDVGFSYPRTGSIPSNGPYAKKTMASAQDGKEVEYKELPEIVVVGGKDKPTINLYRKELDKLKSSEVNPYYGADEFADYYAKMQMAKEFGIPKIRPEEPIGAFERFFRDRSGIKTDPNKPWPQYSPFSKTVYSDFDKYEQSYIPELSHYVSQTKRKEYLGKDNYLQAGLKTLLEYAKGNNPYDVEGTEENFAHQQLQPALQETYWEFIKEGRKKFAESANNAMKRKIYERNKKLQNGGEMKYYQEGLDWKPRNISKNGSVIKDDRGQWAHPGEITEIGSNQITMKGVPYPVLGVSDEGDRQMMYPEKDYKFKGKKVTEYPVKKNGGWLDKYK